MKQSMILLAAALCTLTAGARSLNVTSGAVTYSFPSSQMGRGQVTAGSTLTLQGREFNIADISTMTVVETVMDDNTVEIAYSGSAATVTVAGNVAQYIDATVDGAHVTITQSSSVGDDTCGEINYSLSGTTTDGSLTLNGSYKMSLDLCGVDITNPTGAAIDVECGKRIAVSAKNGTDNCLTDGASGSQKAALYCKGHLELKGKGALTVAGKKGHAISAKEYVELKNCSLTITEAVKDGINCAQYFLQESGSITIKGVGDDALQVDFKDSTDREAEDTGTATITGGTFTAEVTADASKAIKTEGDINVSGGTITAKVAGGGVWDSTNLKTKASSCLSADIDINISGGELNLTATGGGGKGISCDGSLYITDGTVDITTSGGIVYYNGSTINQNYTGSTDNIDSDRKSSPKGIKADTYMQVDGGTISITCGRSEGIESKGELIINSGTITVHSYDDAINSSSHMRINGGDICVVATNNDGLDSNGNLYINGGTIRAFGSSSPEAGIDANDEEGYSVIFTGGTLLAVGGSNGTPSSSASTQPYVSGNGSATAGSTITLKSGSTVLAEFTVPSDYTSSGSGGGFGPGGPGSSSGSAILITCPGLTNGSSYTLTAGTSSSTVTARTTGSGNSPGGR